MALVAMAVAVVWWYFHPRIEIEKGIGYAHRNGSRLSYDVLTPARQNGAAILLIISGSWKSDDDEFDPWPAAGQ